MVCVLFYHVNQLVKHLHRDCYLTWTALQVLIEHLQYFRSKVSQIGLDSAACLATKTCIFDVKCQQPKSRITNAFYVTFGLK